MDFGGGRMRIYLLEPAADTISLARAVATRGFRDILGGRSHERRLGTGATPWQDNIENSSDFIDLSFPTFRINFLCVMSRVIRRVLDHVSFPTKHSAPRPLLRGRRSDHRVTTRMFGACRSKECNRKTGSACAQYVVELFSMRPTPSVRPSRSTTPRAPTSGGPGWQRRKRPPSFPLGRPATWGSSQALSLRLARRHVDYSDCGSKPNRVAVDWLSISWKAWFGGHAPPDTRA